MSKSTVSSFIIIGKFHDIISKYWYNDFFIKDEFGADATRFALAQSGDGVEDANFEVEKANSVILKLHTFQEWVENGFKNIDKGQEDENRAKEKRFVDIVFENDISRLCQLADQSYKEMMYYDAVKYSFHEMLNARDRYLSFCKNEPVDIFLLNKFIEIFCIINSPIIPHFTDYVYQTILQQSNSVLNAKWPELKPFDSTIYETKLYIDDLLHRMRIQSKGQDEITIVYATEYLDWQEQVINVLKEHTISDPSTLIKILSKDERTLGLLKSQKALIPFAKQILNQSRIDEQTVLYENKEYFETILNLPVV